MFYGDLCYSEGCSVPKPAGLNGAWVGFCFFGCRGVQGLGLRVQGLGLKVQGLGLRVQGLGLRAEGSGFRALGSGFRRLRPYLDPPTTL